MPDQTHQKPRRTREYPLKGDTWEDRTGSVVITDAGPTHLQQTKRLVKFKRGRSTGIRTLAAFLRIFKLVKRHPGHASHKPPEPDWEELALSHAAWNHVLIERLRQVASLLKARGMDAPSPSLDILTPYQAATAGIAEYERWVEIETAALKNDKPGRAT